MAALSPRAVSAPLRRRAHDRRGRPGDTRGARPKQAQQTRAGLSARKAGADSAAAQERDDLDGRYAWVALSVTTTGALLAALAGLGAADRPAGHPGQAAGQLPDHHVDAARLPADHDRAGAGRSAGWPTCSAARSCSTLASSSSPSASLLAGLAVPSFHGIDLLIYRVVQGIGGALLLTNSTAIVTDAFQRGRVGLRARRQPDRGGGRLRARAGRSAGC